MKVKIVDKRVAKGTVKITDVPHGSLIELEGELPSSMKELEGGLPTSTKDARRMALVLEKDSVYDPHGDHRNSIPVALLAGQLDWVDHSAHVTLLEATIEVNHGPTV